MSVTADTITDEQIRELRDTLLPSDHYMRQYCNDALSPSSSHPHRQRNARRECASLYNTIRPFQVWDEDGYIESYRTLDEAKKLADFGGES